MITLHESNITSFPHDNGIGVLRDVIRAYAEEELNGLFEFYMEYDSEGHLVDELKEERIIKAKAQDKLGYQLFRIYSITKNHENDNLIVRAQHITYDLADNFVEKLEANNLTKKQVMELIGSSTALPHPFNITSPNTTTRSSTKLYRTNPLQMIGGMEGSVLQIWGGQIERDNFNLILHDRRGSDDGVKVTYEKNITGLEATFDISGLVTRIFPFVYIEATDNEPARLITVNGKYIDSPLINNYEKIYIKPIDYSNDERIDIQDKTDAQIRQQLTNIASKYFEETGNDKIKVDMEVQFEHLWETEEYKDLAVLELVGLGDTVTINHSKLKVDATAIVNYIRYDCIAEKNEEVRLGSVKARLTDNVNKVVDVAEKAERAEQTANQAIRAANGKNTIYYGPDEPSSGIEGDLWFRVVDGEYTRTYRHDGIQWQLVLSVDVRDAMDEAQQAKDEAQQAVDRANQATQQATDAINQAQTAFDEAQAALSTANNALTQATSAFSKAQEGFDLAQDAIDELANLEIGGRNLLVEGEMEWGYLSSSTGELIPTAVDEHNRTTGYIDVSNINTITLSQYDNIDDFAGRGRVIGYDKDKNFIGVIYNNVDAASGWDKPKSITLNVSDVYYIRATLIWWGRNRYKLEKGNRATDWTPAPEDVDQKIDVVANDLDGLSVIVSNNVGEITSIQATTQGLRTDVRNLQGDVTTVTQIATGLQSRMSDAEGNITALQVTSTSLAGRLTDAEGNITTLTATVNGLQTTVSNIEGDVSSVTQLANALQTRMTNAEGNISTLTQTASSLQSTVSSLQDEWDNLEIGGRNLLVEGEMEWGYLSSSTGELIPAAVDGHNRTTGYIDVSNISTITLSQYDNIDDFAGLGRVIGYDKDKNFIGVIYNNINVSNGWNNPKSIVLDVSEYHYIRATLIWWGRNRYKLEKGNRATDWTPAPEDMATQSQITQLSDAINLRVQKGDVINQINISDESILIDGKRIHITGQTTIDDASIDGAKIKNASIGNAQIGYIDAAKIATGTLQSIDIYGVTIRGSTIWIDGDRPDFLYTNAIDTNPNTAGKHIYIRPTTDGEVRATVTNTIDQYVPMRASQFKAAPLQDAYITTDEMLRVTSHDKSTYRDIRGNVIYGAGFTTTTTNAYIGTDNVLHVVNKGYVQGSAGDPIYRDIRANDVYNRAMITTTTNAYIGTDNELRVVNKGLTDIYRDVRALGFIGNRVGLGVHVSGAKHFYVQPAGDGEVRITERSGGGTYRPIRASSFNEASSRDYKTNIEKYNESALDVINDLTVVTYNLIDDLANGILEKKIGFISEDSPAIATADGKAIQMYQLSAYNTKAIQELDSKFTNLEDEINWLKIENQYLRQKIEQLEEMIA